jgi:hypothetical protein
MECGWESKYGAIVVFLAAPEFVLVGSRIECQPDVDANRCVAV